MTLEELKPLEIIIKARLIKIVQGLHGYIPMETLDMAIKKDIEAIYPDEFELKFNGYLLSHIYHVHIKKIKEQHPGFKLGFKLDEL